MPGPIPDPDDSSSLDGFFENDDTVNGEKSGKHTLYDVRCRNDTRYLIWAV